MNHEDYALVVGINRYTANSPAELHGAERDAQAFYEWLVDPAGGALPAQNVVRLIAGDLPSPVPATPFSLRPHKDEIDAALYALGIGEKARVGRRFYLYFAGHGLGARFDEVALLLAGARTPNLLGLNLGLTAYRRLLREAAPFDEIVFLLDCCRELDQYTVAQAPAIGHQPADDRQDKVRDFVALASRFGKRAFEPLDPASGVRQGLFTKALLEGLRGQAADNRGDVTAESLKAYLAVQLPRLAEQHKRTQSPEVQGDADHTLVFCNVAEALGWPLLAPPTPPDWDGEVALFDSGGRELHRRGAAPAWSVRLRDGLYRLVHAASGQERVFVVASGQLLALPAPGGGVPTGLLEVTAPNELAEIKVYDGNGQVVGRSQGALRHDLPQGDYQVEVTLADGRASRAVTVSAATPVKLESRDLQADLLFTSAAPLYFTRTSHEYHMDPATALSRTPTWQGPGGGDSRLFIFVRTVDRNRFPVTVRGLSLQDADGRLLNDFTVGVVIEPNAGLVALTADLPAGPYLLAYEPGAGYSRTQPLWLCAGWETHVFIPCRERLYLEDLSLSMAERGAGFQPGDWEAGATEVVLAGLEQGRNLASGEQLRQMLHGKFRNPWLGILAAHALRLDARPDKDLLSLVLGNVQAMVGEHFPDLRALRLDPEQPAEMDGFAFPPMLRAGLDLAQRHSLKHQTTIPPTSLTARLYDGLLADSPWTAWRSLSAVERAPARASISVERLVKVLDQRGQSVAGPQTNIAVSVAGPVLSGSFQGPVNVGNINVGNITGAMGVAIGHGAQANVSFGGQPADPLARTFEPFFVHVRSMLRGAEQEDALDCLNKLLGEGRKGPGADAGRLKRCVDGLVQLWPEFRAAAWAQFNAPGSGAGPQLLHCVQPPPESTPLGAPAQIETAFRAFVLEQDTGAIAAVLGLPYFRVQAARAELVREGVFERALGPVETGVLQHLWARFEFEALKPQRR
jgi:hypothetical protein